MYHDSVQVISFLPFNMISTEFPADPTFQWMEPLVSTAMHENQRSNARVGSEAFAKLKCTTNIQHQKMTRSLMKEVQTAVSNAKRKRSAGLVAKPAKRAALATTSSDPRLSGEAIVAAIVAADFKVTNELSQLTGYKKTQLYQKIKTMKDGYMPSALVLDLSFMHC